MPWAAWQIVLKTVHESGVAAARHYHRRTAARKPSAAAAARSATASTTLRRQHALWAAVARSNSGAYIFLETWARLLLDATLKLYKA